MIGLGKLRNKVALITGASSGIGLATAQALASEGCSVILVARRAERLSAVANDLGNSAFSLPLDLQNKWFVDNCIASLPQHLRSIDILVNNAGHDPGGIVEFAKGDREAWVDMIETNIQALIRITHVVLPIMLARGRGDIVNVGSPAGLKTSPRRAVYGATKAAVHSFSQSLRTEVANAGIRVMEVIPGLTRSEFALRRLKGNEEKAEKFYAEAGTSLEADDVAQAVLFAVTQPPHVTVGQLVLLPSSARRTD